MKVNTFIIGAPKCGTTSICNLLERHPNICVVPGKEPRFFSNDNRYAKGIDYYESLFHNYYGEDVIVDGSTTYSEALLDRYIKSAERIYRYNPNANIIYCVRNPIKRIESQWLNMLSSHDAGFDLSRNGINFTANFNKDIKTNPEIYKTCNYWKIFQYYASYFNENNIKVIFFEDFIQNQSHIVNEIGNFLNLNMSSLKINQIEKANVSYNKRLYTPIGKLFLKIPKYQLIASKTPNWLKSLVRQFSKQKHQLKRPEWENSVFREVIDYLKEDNRKFLNYMGKSQQYWSDLEY